MSDFVGTRVHGVQQLNGLLRASSTPVVAHEKCAIAASAAGTESRKARAGLSPAKDDTRCLNPLRLHVLCLALLTPRGVINHTHTEVCGRGWVVRAE